MKRLYLFFTLLLIFSIGNVRADIAETEPNDALAQADFIPTGETAVGGCSAVMFVSNDIDWFEIHLPSAGNLTLNVTSTGIPTQTTLYTAGGGTITFSVGSGTYNLNANGLSAGTYYISLSVTTFGTALYDLSYSQTVDPYSADAEPNDTPANATNFTLNSVREGHIGYLQSSGVRETQDWYVLHLTGNGNLSLELESLYGISLGATLFDSTGVTAVGRIGAAFTTTGTVEQVIGGLAKGTYYLRITPQFTGQWTPYRLENALITPCTSADPEPNDLPALATPISLGSTFPAQIGFIGAADGEDWFVLNLPQDGMLNVQLTACESSLMFLTLFGPDGISALTGEFSGTNFSLQKDGLSAGTYYLRVRVACCFPFGVGYNTYTLNPVLSTYAYAADTQPNDWAAQAPTLPSNGTRTGHIGFSGSTPYDARDWYKINYTGSGNLNLSIDALPNLGSSPLLIYRLAVYADTAAAPIYSAVINTSDPAISLSGLSAGYYYVLVQPNTCCAATFFAYRLINSYVEGDPASFNQFLSMAGSGCNNNRLRFRCSGSQPPYRVQLYLFGDAVGPEILVEDNLSRTISNLPAGRYTARVLGDGASVAVAGYSPYRDVVAAPVIGSTTDISASSARINWTGLPTCMDGYQLRLTQGGSLVGQAIVSSALNSRNITGLLPGTTYEFTVRAGLQDNDSPDVALSALASGSFSTLPALADGESARLFSSDADFLAGVYPVPASDQLRFLPTETAPQQLTVYDQNGRLMFAAEGESAASAALTGIDVSEWPAGVYLISAVSVDGKQQNLSFSIAR